MGLLDVATVARGGGQWTSGYDLEESGCGLAVRVSEVCSPTPGVVIGNPDSDPNVLKIDSFGIEAVLKRNVRCALDQDIRRVDTTLEGGQERAIAHVFENGPAANWPSPHLLHPDANVVAAGADHSASAVLALEAYFAAAAGIPVLHLGIGAAVAVLSESMVATLEALQVPVSVSAGYSSNLIAATGPVLIRIGPSETLQSYDVVNNKTDIVATEVAAIEFDVCHAFRIGQT